MNEEKEPVVPVPAGVLAALEAMCILGDSCKTINYKGVLDTISSRAEEVEEGLSGTISALSLSYMMFEIEKTQGEEAAKKLTSEILGRFQGKKKEALARFVASAIDDFEKMYRGDENEHH
nr:MAG TPA: hypothetical protein [Caudoviricetes sp.]